MPISGLGQLSREWSGIDVVRTVGRAGVHSHVGWLLQRVEQVNHWHMQQSELSIQCPRYWMGVRLWQSWEI